MLNEEKIIRECEERGLICNFGANVIFIKTNVSRWRLIHNGTKITCVMHENYRVCNRQYQNGNFKSGYHKQKLKNYSVYSVLDYIVQHDKRFFQKAPVNADDIFNRAYNQKFVMA